MLKKLAVLVNRGLCWLGCYMEDGKQTVIETCERAITSLRLKGAVACAGITAWGNNHSGFWGKLASQAGKGGMEALFSMALLGIVLIIFVMKAAPSMFEASNAVQSATGTDAPDATSKGFMGMLPWIFIGILTVVLIMVMIAQVRRRRS